MILPVTHATSTIPSTGAVEEATDATTEPQLVAEDLIEEVSIDGMCGVY
jgi:mycofactocin precursor